MNRIIIVAAAASLWVVPHFVRAQELPPDLAAVPGSAVGFVHVRVAELWKGDALKDVRRIVAKAGPEYLRMLDQRFVPSPSSIERVTIILMKGEHGPNPLIAIATKEPMDREKLMKESLKGSQERRVGEASYHVDVKNDVAVFLAGERLLIAGGEVDLKSYLTRREKAQGPLADALKVAAGAKPVTMAIDGAALPAELFAEVPPPVRALLRSAVVRVSVEPGNAPKIELRLHYADAKSADAAEAAMKESVASLRQLLDGFRKDAERALFEPNKDARSSIESLPEATAALAGLGFIARANDILGNLPVKREGNDLAATIDVPEGPAATVVSTTAIAMGFLLPAVQKVREAAARMKSSNNMKQIALAFHNYESAFGSLPPAAISDKKGKPLLSWRVAILPYIEQDNLYRQFKLDEPWDSEHNLKLAKLRIAVYTHPTQQPKGEFPLTHYLAFVGPGAAFEPKGSLKFSSFADGTSTTIWLAESEDGVPWTKPEDFAYDPKKMPPVGFKWGRSSCLVGFVDGSIRTLTRNVPETTWHLLIQRADGQAIPNDLDK